MSNVHLFTPTNRNPSVADIVCVKLTHSRCTIQVTLIQLLMCGFTCQFNE